MDVETVEYLLSPQGEELLVAAASLQGTFLQRMTILRKDYPAQVVSAALELLELRKRAVRKFTRADRMFFTREALEQSSGETISRYRAGRFRADSRVLDLACGIGGDTIGLASRCYVTAVDRDAVRVAMARRNARVYGLEDRVTFVCSDVTDIEPNADAAFVDPSRRSEGRRVRGLGDLQPSIEFLHTLRSAIPDCAIKLSPAFHDHELESFGGEIEFISESGECKEALIWLGAFATTPRRATVLPQNAGICYHPVEPIPVRPPEAYVYEPDPCVIRAHLVEHFAHDIGAAKIDEQIAYLTSETLIRTQLADAYRVVDHMPFNLRAVNRRLAELSAGSVVVKKRGVPYEPREMEKRLKTVGTEHFILILTRAAGRPWALICTSATDSAGTGTSVD